jgi:hypothetical protein
MNRLARFSRIGISTSVLVVGVALSSVVLAEDATHAHTGDKKSWTSPFFSPKIGNLYFLGGVGFFDVDDLNDDLSDNRYSELKSPALSLGFGTDVSIGHLILGGEWNWMKNVATESERDNIRADIKSHYWLFRIGVDLVKWRGLRVYPLLGIGASHTRFFISNEQGQSFRDVLDTPTREVRMSQTGLLLDASLGIDYRFKMRETEYKSSFFTVGVRGGYLFSPYSGNWETATADISGGPDTLTSGPTVQLLVGFSGERKHPYSRCGECRSRK